MLAANRELNYQASYTSGGLLTPLGIASSLVKGPVLGAVREVPPSPLEVALCEGVQLRFVAVPAPNPVAIQGDVGVRIEYEPVEAFVAVVVPSGSQITMPEVTEVAIQMG